MEVLQWLRNQNPPCPWDIYTCVLFAAQSGDLNILQWLRSQNPQCSWNRSMCEMVATEKAHVHILKLIQEQNPEMNRIKYFLILYFIWFICVHFYFWLLNP